MGKQFELKPITFREACQFVRENHRHHKPPTGHKFSLAAVSGGEIIGVVMAGRPVSRHLDDGWTLEVNRLCTDGTKNACSFLYSAAWRTAKSMGYKKMITYVLASEPGSSLKATGWKDAGEAGGICWTGSRKTNNQKYPAEMKRRYEISV